MGQRVGKRIIQALGAVQRLQPCTVHQVQALMPGVEWSNVDKYCSRAVGHGLMTVDRTRRPKLYSVVPGWQEQLQEWRQPTLPEPKPTPVACVAMAIERRSPLELAWQALR